MTKAADKLVDVQEDIYTTALPIKCT